MSAVPLTAHDVVIAPPSRPGFMNLTSYGAVDGGGRHVPLGPLMMSSRAHYAIQRRVMLGNPVNVLTGGHVWAGMIYGHFGHFIAETLPRLLSIRASLDANPGTRILGFAAPNVMRTDLSGMAWFLEKAGIDRHRIDLITEPTRVTRLVLPATPFAGRYAYLPAVATLIDQYGLSAANPSGERIFLSRGLLAGAASRVRNIHQIETLFAAAGYTILHPEKLDMAEQVARITAARVLAGENGSALHWSLYSSKIERVQSLGWSLALQRGICAVRGQEYQVLRDRGFGAFKGRRQLVDPDLVRQYLR